MNDIWGNKLEIGDQVVCKSPIVRYSYFCKGEVVGFTQMKVRIHIYEDNTFSLGAGMICLKDPMGVSKRLGQDND